MAISYLCIVLAVLKIVNSADRGSSCITPNGESALCISIDDCNILKEPILAGNKSAIEFGKKSQCGYDTAPLVCCATTTYPTPHPVFDEIFTKDPATTEKPVRKEPIGLSTTSSTLLPNKTICGWETETPRILGGTVTGIDEFPWMALIGYKNRNNSHVGFKCGGTLINNRYVLTAAHCILTALEPFYAYKVRLGEWNLATEEDCVEGVAIDACSDPVVDVAITRSIPHQDFNRRNSDNNIGLLLLERDVKYTDFIRPICLPSNDLPMLPEATLMTVCGWGATENGTQSNLKLKVEVPLVSNSECNIRFASGKISPNQVCAGGVAGKDSCRGDSGGPLMRTYTNDTFQWYQEGVVSWGIGCGRNGYPSVYTRVSRYVNWIITNIEISDSEL